MNARTDRRRDQGSALLVAVLLMALLGAIGLAGLEAASQDRQTAGVQNRKRIAFWAAESGIAEARNDMRNGGVPTLAPSTNVGDSSLHPYGLPTYVPEETTDLGTSAIPGFQLRVSGNGPTYQLHFFRVRVRGQAPGGTQSRVEIVANAIDTSS
jgi:hypothetical protein